MRSAPTRPIAAPMMAEVRHEDPLAPAVALGGIGAVADDMRGGANTGEDEGAACGEEGEDEGAAGSPDNKWVFCRGTVTDLTACPLAIARARGFVPPSETCSAMIPPMLPGRA